MTEEKKSPWGSVLKFLDLFGTAADYIIKHTDNEIKKIKEKVVHYLLIYGMLVIAIFFIMVGIVKYLSEVLVFSEGLLFIIFGAVIIVLLAFISLIKDV